MNTELKDEGLYEVALKEVRMDNADINKVLDLLTKAHALGDARATYALATWYLHGHNVLMDMDKAISFLRKADKRGIAPASYDLAVCYEKGMGVKKSRARAIQLYTKAALLGDRPSIYEVGRCIYFGFGVSRDKKYGMMWIDLARRFGVVEDEDHGCHPRP
ncbi:MAG: sel1 repeat family protein [Candidatus Schekmanbacteria bacterium]|nr:sel1 repeat family protein [Candidatus Schekmanbacteria bacterium]